jgi:hypothetical protein
MPARISAEQTQPVKIGFSPDQAKNASSHSITTPRKT